MTPSVLSTDEHHKSCRNVDSTESSIRICPLTGEKNDFKLKIIS